MRSSALEDFYTEVNQNRSALLNKDFKSTWGFLGLNPEFLEKESCEKWYKEVFQYHFLEQLLENNQSNEIFIHEDSSLCDEDLLYALENIALVHNQSWNTRNPYLSTKVTLNKENFRLTMIHPHIISQTRPRAFLRRHKSRPIDLKSYLPHVKLRGFVDKKNNILISGSTGSGKTTLAQSLLSSCKKDEHIVILEDTHELSIEGGLCTHFLSDEKNSLIEFCSYALRISPDRIVLGELRGEEVLPLTLAMNTGHNGFISTIHSNNAVGALHRLKTLLEFFSPKTKTGFQLICQNIDIVIHMENKKIVEMIKVLGTDGERPMFQRIFSSGKEQLCEAQ